MGKGGIPPSCGKAADGGPGRMIGSPYRVWPQAMEIQRTQKCKDFDEHITQVEAKCRKQNASTTELEPQVTCFEFLTMPLSRLTGTHLFHFTWMLLRD
jgi:hypothetical protein